MVLTIIIHQLLGKALGEVRMETPCYPPQKESLPSFVLKKKLEFILFKSSSSLKLSNCTQNMYIQFIDSAINTSQHNISLLITL